MRRLRAVLQALVALAALAGIVVGVPFALAALADWPITGVPTAEQLEDVPTTMLTDDALLGAVVVALWAAWAVFVLVVVAEIVAQARGLHRPTISLGGPVQRLAGFLVGSIAVGLASPAAASAPPELPAAATAELPAGSPSTTELQVTDVPEGTFEEWVAYLADEDAEAPYQPTSASIAEQNEDVPETITVKHDDTAWSLAERYLGDGMRWREIFELNRDTVQADGSVWDNASDDVEPGWRLVLPTDAETGEPPADGTLAVDAAGGDSAGGGSAGGDSASGAGQPAAEEVEVVPGDHFWGLAKQQLTDAWGRTPSDAEMTPYWQDVVEHNRDRLLPPEDPDLIYPQQTFTLPATPADPSAPPPPAEPTEPEEPAAPAEEEQDNGATAEQPDDVEESAEAEEEADAGSGDDDGSGSEDSSESEAPPRDGDEEDEAADSMDDSGDLEEPEDTEDGSGHQEEIEQDNADHGPPGEGDTGLPTEPIEEDEGDGLPAEPPSTADSGAETPIEEDEGDGLPAEPPTTAEDPGAGTPPPTAPTAPGDSAAPGPPATEGQTTEDQEAAPAVPDETSTTAAVLLPEVQDTVSSDEESSGRSLAPIGLVGGGIALAGAVLLLERRRRAQQRHRRRGRAAEMPNEELRGREQELRHGADVDGARLLDVALRAAAAGSGTTGLPTIRWVETTEESVTLVMGQPSPAPPGFKNLSADRWTTSSSQQELATMGASAAPPMPALMTVGTTEDSTEVLADLEASGVISVTGARSDVEGLLRAMAVAAATAPWHEQTRLLLVGMAGELTDLPWVESLERLDDAVLEAEAHATRTASSLRAIDCPTTAQARAAGMMSEQWDPLIVLSAVPPEDPELVRRLGALAEQSHSAVALVVPGPLEGTSSRKLTLLPDGELELEGLDVTAWGHLLDENDSQDLVGLLGVATRLRDVEWGTPEAGEPEPVRRPAVRAGSATEAEAELDDGEAGTETEDGEDPYSQHVLEPIQLEPLDELISEDVSDLIGESVGEQVGAAGELAAEPPAEVAVAAGSEAATDESSQVPAAASAERAASEGVVAPIDDLGALMAEVDILVRVLGEVEVVALDPPSPGGGALERGARQERKLEVTRQKGLEAITYLALRESAVYKEDLESALFPDGANVAKTLYNTISSARNMVGEGLFPRVPGGRYELSERVVTDYGLFCELVAQAEETDDAARAADRLAGALSFVRGEPFIGVGRNFAWVGAHRGMIVAQVVDAADELGEVRLAMGDWRAAEWAARQGLRAFPADERMYRLLMRTARAAGNAPGVQRVFRELCDVIADPDLGVEPEDTLHPETVALFEELTGSSPRYSKV